MSLAMPIILWGLVGLSAVVVVFVIVRGRGWLDLPGTRWPRFAFGLALALGVWPAFLGAGAIQGARDSAVGIVRDEAERSEAREVLGHLLVTPMLVASGNGNAAFLRDDAERRRVAEKLTVADVRVALAMSPPPPDRPAARWLRGQAETLLTGRHGYDALFADLTESEGGGLSRRWAAWQVGDAFLERHAYPRIAADYDRARRRLLGGAAVLLVLALVVIRLVVRAHLSSSASRQSS